MSGRPGEKGKITGPIPGLAEIDARDAELRAAGINPSQVEYGESRIGAGSSRTPEEITDEARGIYDEVQRAQAAGLDFRDDARVGELRKRLQGDHPEFVSGFPIPFRWMVETGEFDPEVFRRWLVQTQKQTVWDNRHVWLEAQATYLTRLYKFRNPRASAKEMSAFTKRTVKTLSDEEESYQADVAESKEEVEKENAAAVDDLRQRLKAFCENRTAPQLATHLRRLASGCPEREERLRVALDDGPSPTPVVDE